MTMEEIHATVAAVAGKISLALVRRRARRQDYIQWATTLKAAVAAIEARTPPEETHHGMVG
jgi:hypothetical protein